MQEAQHSPTSFPRFPLSLPASAENDSSPARTNHQPGLIIRPVFPCPVARCGHHSAPPSSVRQASGDERAAHRPRATYPSTEPGALALFPHSASWLRRLDQSVRRHRLLAFVGRQEKPFLLSLKIGWQRVPIPSMIRAARRPICAGAIAQFRRRKNSTGQTWLRNHSALESPRRRKLNSFRVLSKGVARSWTRSRSFFFPSPRRVIVNSDRPAALLRYTEQSHPDHFVQLSSFVFSSQYHRLPKQIMELKGARGNCRASHRELHVLWNAWGGRCGFTLGAGRESLGAREATAAIPSSPPILWPVSDLFR